jgi:E3 ubiquitin-protein ligase UBR1
LQVFTVPSIAGHVVRQHGIITRILAIISAFFTNQIANKRIIYPPNPSIEVDVESAPFRSKRFMPIFSDLRYLCSNESVQRLITRNQDFIMQFAKVCQLFMGINANKRVLTNHVEYETDAWISVFNVTLSLSRVVKVYGEAYAKATTADLVSAISSIVQEILAVCTMSEARLDKDKYAPIVLHDVTFDSSVYRVVNFDVLHGWVSFHHALHWLLAELFKHVNILSYDRLREIGIQSLADIVHRQPGDATFLSVLDFPLRGES